MKAAFVLGRLLFGVMHDFWRNENPQERAMHMITFMKNAALVGAALALLRVEEPWEASVPAGQAKLREALRADGRRLAA